MAIQFHMTMLEDLKRAAWGRTTPVSGDLNAWEFRKDCCGNLIRYNDFGNRHSPFGWELDTVTRASGSANDPDNFQALHWKATSVRAEPQLRLMTVAEAEDSRRR
jgi:hypothetical protein